MKITYEINTLQADDKVHCNLVAERLEFMAALLRSEANGGHVVSKVGPIWSTEEASITLMSVSDD